MMGIVAIGLLFASTHEIGLPSSPEKSLAAILVPDDLVVELVAAEPMIVDPVALAFDADGVMYVAEFRDYPTGPANPADPPLSRISRLTDRNGDGRMDEHCIFADRLPSCQGLMPWRDGLIVTTANQILWLRDTDQDGVADQRLVLYEGLGRQNTQLQPAFPVLSMDNWVYVTNGLSGGNVYSPLDADHKVDISKSDMRFDPLTGAIEPATGLGQFGNTLDGRGNRFTTSNRNPIMHEILPHRAVQRNPFANLGKGYHDCAPAGADSRVYPLAETTTTAFTHTGTHTAACGILCFLGDGLGVDYVGNIFVCEPTAYLVTRQRLDADGVTFRAERILQSQDPKLDWLVSSDPWFRPVSLANGPDGAMYLCDMYRGVIEHPIYMPPGMEANVNPRLGDDRGRIYRIRSRQIPPRAFMQPRNSAEILHRMEDPNGWCRALAQRLLLEAESVDVHELRDFTMSSKVAEARARGLRILEARGQLDDALLRHGLMDEDPLVVEQSLRILAERNEADPSWNEWLVRLVADPVARLRFFAILAMPDGNEDRILSALADRAVADATNPWIRAAVLSAANQRAAAILQKMLPILESTREPDLAAVESLAMLADIVAAVGEPAEFRALLHLALREECVSPIRAALLRGLAEGANRHSRGRIPRWSQLVDQPPDEWREESGLLRPVLSDYARIVDSTVGLESDRLAALRLISQAPGDSTARILARRLTSAEPESIQRAALAALSASGNDAVLELLVERWDGLSADVQVTAAGLFLRRRDSMLRLLDLMDQGTIPAGVLGIDQRTSLLLSRDDQIRKRAEAIFGGSVSENRQEVLARYLPALQREGNVEVGRAVFKRLCANCHRRGPDGTAVGPDISDVRSKSPAQLLADILDPDRVVEPRYASSLVQLVDGRVITGLVTRESSESVTLLLAGGQEETIGRTLIEEITRTKKSLMPVGVESDITVEAMADLLAFLRAGR